jgi:hypothetical protein
MCQLFTATPPTLPHPKKNKNKNRKKRKKEKRFWS